MGHSYRERHQATAAAPTTNEQDNDLDADNLPGRHAPLDELAAERGVVWSADDLTVAQKKDELAAALESDTVATTTTDDIEGLT